MTPSGIEPVTFRLEVLCLNQLRHRLAQLIVDAWINYWTPTPGSVFIAPVPNLDGRKSIRVLDILRYLGWQTFVFLVVV